MSAKCRQLISWMVHWFRAFHIRNVWYIGMVRYLMGGNRIANNGTNQTYCSHVWLSELCFVWGNWMIKYFQSKINKILFKIATSAICQYIECVYCFKCFPIYLMTPELITHPIYSVFKECRKSLARYVLHYSGCVMMAYNDLPLFAFQYMRRSSFIFICINE